MTAGEGSDGGVAFGAAVGFPRDKAGTAFRRAVRVWRADVSSAGRIARDVPECPAAERNVLASHRWYGARLSGARQSFRRGTRDTVPHRSRLARVGVRRDATANPHLVVGYRIR